jgi:hypothetical protein
VGGNAGFFAGACVRGAPECPGGEAGVFIPGGAIPGPAPGGPGGAPQPEKKSSMDNIARGNPLDTAKRALPLNALVIFLPFEPKFLGLPGLNNPLDTMPQTYIPNNSLSTLCSVSSGRMNSKWLLSFDLGGIPNY